MPLIQIDLDREVFDTLGEQLSSAVHQAQLDVLEIPADDLFQVFTPHGPGELLGWPTLVGRSRAAEDRTLARELWRESERLTGTRFPWPPVSSC